MNIEQHRAAFEAVLSDERIDVLIDGPQIVTAHLAARRGDARELMRIFARQVEKAAIEADRKRRGEPVAYIRVIPYDDRGNAQRDLIDADIVGDLSKYADFVTFIPLYTAPQPAGRTDHFGDVTKMVPSDDEDYIVDLISEYGDHNVEHGRISFDKWTLREAVSALLARYSSGQPAASAEPVGPVHLRDEG